jgi:hypothetical protein
MTVGQYLDHCCDNVAKPGVHETTWNSYERCVKVEPGNASTLADK